MQTPFVLTKASDASHKRVTVLMFGESGIGKTSLTKTLNVTDDGKVFYIGADPGQLALRNRDFVVAQAPDGEWNEAVMDAIYHYLLREAASYEWVVVDGLDELGAAVLRSRAKVQRDMRKAYGEMGDYMAVWAKRIRDLKGCSIMFITHIGHEQDETGAMNFFPSFPGKAVTEQLNDWFDLVGCMRSVKTDTGVKRLIQFKPEADPRFKVKDRSGVMNDYEEPDLGAIFKRIHEAGFTTHEPAGPPPPEKRTEEDLAELASAASRTGKSRAAVVQYAESKYGRKPSELNVTEFADLLKWTNEEN